MLDSFISGNTIDSKFLIKMAEAPTVAQDNVYVLYYYSFSLYSIMVRYAIALRREPNTLEPAMVIEQREVLLIEDQQLDQDFLLKVNPRGQVRSTTFYPIGSTLSINFPWLDTRYPC